MIVAELMTQTPLTVEPRDTLQLAYEKMEAGRFRQVPVVDQERLAGILTDRDTRQHLGQLAYIRVGAVMTVHPYTVRVPSTSAQRAASALKEYGFKGHSVQVVRLSQELSKDQKCDLMYLLST